MTTNPDKLHYQSILERTGILKQGFSQEREQDCSQHFEEYHQENNMLNQETRRENWRWYTETNDLNNQVLAVRGEKHKCYAFAMEEAILLLKECGGTLWFDPVIDLWECLIEGDPDIMKNRESPAVAICEVYLAWKTRRVTE